MFHRVRQVGTTVGLLGMRLLFNLVNVYTKLAKFIIWRQINKTQNLLSVTISHSIIEVRPTVSCDVSVNSPERRLILHRGTKGSRTWCYWLLLLIFTVLAPNSVITAIFLYMIVVNDVNVVNLVNVYTLVSTCIATRVHLKYVRLCVCLSVCLSVCMAISLSVCVCITWLTETGSGSRLLAFSR